MSSKADELAARLKAFADRVLAFIQSLPFDPRIESIFTQLIRSSSSQSANYRAARRGRSRKEFIAKLGSAAEEADESEGWLERLLSARLALGRVARTELECLYAESRELRAILVKSFQTSRTNYVRMIAEKRRLAKRKGAATRSR